MKRRVIQLAGKTHVVSLPSKWVQRHGVKKGDELDVLEKENHLLIKTTSMGTLRKIKVDLSGLHERPSRHFLSALHKSGYDEIEILYDTPQTIKIVQDLLKNLFTGFAIMEHTPKRCVLKSIAQDIREEFDPTLRRAFLVTLSLADSTLELIKTRQYHNLKELTILENTNNQLTNFCERIINKYAYEEKNTFLYVIAWNLEKIADEYKYLCELLYGYTKPLQPPLLTFHTHVNMFLKSYYHFFYNYDPKELNHLNAQAEEIKNMMKMIHPKNSYEQQAITILSSITMKTIDFSSSMIALHHQRSLS